MPKPTFIAKRTYYWEGGPANPPLFRRYVGGRWRYYKA